MTDPKERLVEAPRGLDLRALFWALGVWTVVSLAFSVSLALSNSAQAQSGKGFITRIVDVTNNQGVVDLRPTGRETGQPIPRFVSFRNDKTNMRVGPGIEFELRAIYNRQGLPVQVVAESGHWREVQDWEGTRGWVHKDLLSSRRTARVSGALVDLLRQPAAEAKPVARLSHGVLADLKSCQGDWCILQVENVSGWFPRSQLFGAFTHEDFS